MAKLAFSYSHRDEEYRDILAVHLETLRRQGCKRRMESPRKCRRKIPQVAGPGKAGLIVVQLRSLVGVLGAVVAAEG